MLPVPCIVRRIWTVFLIFHSQIFCVRGDCGPPPAIEHTEPVSVTSGVAGDTFIYVCDHSTGYYELPDKSKTITCQDDNTWTSVSEFCARACGVPERLDFAVPKDRDLKNIYLPGTKVSFDCRLGYVRVAFSINSITCLENYTWSIPSEFCTRKSCGSPGDTQNGDFEVTDGFVFGSKATYKCYTGYRIVNRRNYRDCQADGKWTNDVPTCEAVLCPAPESPDNGSYDPVKDEYTYQEAVNFYCNKNLHVIGSTSASCTSDGTWSASPPTCRAISCEDPGPIQNGRKLSGFVGPYTLNSAVRYECVETFVMNGSSSVTCNIDSRWEPEIPKCLSACDAPPNYAYAVLEEQHIPSRKYFDKTTVDYKCKPGFEKDPKKDNTITCIGRSWSTLAEFCSPVSCGDPGEVLNAERSVSKYTFGSRVEYKCRQGYIITSSSKYKECQADRNWSPGEIICTATCQFPSHATLNLNPVKPGTTGLTNVYILNEVVTLECTEGFVLNGSSSVTCHREGLWKPSIPKCNELTYDGDNKIGIIVGSILGSLAVLGAAIILYCCLKKKKSGKPKSDTPDVHYVACNNA